jgi:hypothetical protein
MQKYTYKNKKTGATVTSDTPIVAKDYVLVTQVRNGMIKSNKVNKK